MLVDGHRVSRQPSAAFNLNDLAVTVERIERIEVTPAPASLVYGLDAVGGVVNVITRPAGVTPAIGVSYGRGAEAEQRIAGGVQYGFKKLGLRFDGQLPHRRRLSRQRRRRSEEFHGGAGGRPRPVGAGCALDIAQPQRRGSRPRREPLAGGAAGGRPRRAARGRPLQVRQRLGPEGRRLHAQPGVAVQRSGPAGRRPAGCDGGDRPPAGQQFDRRRGAAEFRHEEGRDLHRRRRVGRRQGRRPRRRGPRRRAVEPLHAGPVAQGGWSAVGVLRRDEHSEYGGKTLPSLSVGWGSGGWKLWAAWAKNFRTPSFDDLYWDEQFLKGNPDLEPETSESYDGGIEMGGGWGRVRLSAFRRSVKNLISWADTDGDYVYQPGERDGGDGQRLGGAGAVPPERVHLDPRRLSAALDAGRRDARQRPRRRPQSVAGGDSGDRHLAHLVARIRRHRPRRLSSTATGTGATPSSTRLSAGGTRSARSRCRSACGRRICRTRTTRPWRATRCAAAPGSRRSRSGYDPAGDIRGERPRGCGTSGWRLRGGPFRVALALSLIVHLVALFVLGRGGVRREAAPGLPQMHVRLVVPEPLPDPVPAAPAITPPAEQAAAAAARRIGCAGSGAAIRGRPAATAGPGAPFRRTGARAGAWRQRSARARGREALEPPRAGGRRAQASLQPAGVADSTAPPIPAVAAPDAPTPAAGMPGAAPAAALSASAAAGAGPGGPTATVRRARGSRRREPPARAGRRRHRRRRGDGSPPGTRTAGSLGGPAPHRCPQGLSADRRAQRVGRPRARGDASRGRRQPGRCASARGVGVPRA